MDEHHTQQHAAHSGNRDPHAQEERGGLEVAQRIVPFEPCQRQFLDQYIFGIVHDAAEQRC
jgi:hypothetical protein